MTNTDTNVKASDLIGSLSCLERLENEKKEIQYMIKQVLLEAKVKGIEPKILRKIVSIRQKDKLHLDEENALLELYMNKIGMHI